MAGALYIFFRRHRPSAGCLALSMINVLLVFVLASLLNHASCHPVDWLRKLSAPKTHDDGSSWLWGWVWAADGTVSIVDRSPPVTFPARPASFGAELADPLLGYVIPLSSFAAPCSRDPHNHTLPDYPFEADPVLGCPELCTIGTRQPDDADTWIALVQRGGCPFVEKARQAQRLGAKAVVVGGDRDTPDALLNMFSEQDASDVKIAATYIKYWDYQLLTSMIAASNTTHNGLKTLSLLISTEYSAWEWYSPIITFIIILLLPSCLTFLTLLIHRIRAARAAQRDRAPESVVFNLPSRVWNGTGWEKEQPTTFVPADVATSDGQPAPGQDQGAQDASTSQEQQLPPWVEAQAECAICLEMFVKGDRVRVLPCYHLFHIDEVDEWLIHKKKLCPICKADVTQPHTPPAVPDALEVHPHSEEQPLAPAASSSRSPSASAALSERTPLLQLPEQSSVMAPSG